MKTGVYSKIVAGVRRNKPQLAVLIDPDKFNPELISMCAKLKVSYFFVGGSRIHSGNFEKTIAHIKKHSHIPVVIFPGDETQLSAKADGMLLLSLVSGRNPEYLIGKHVKAAAEIKKKKIETIATAYLLIDGARESVTQQVTSTEPLQDKKDIVHTAMAAEMLGFKVIYLEAGSGAEKEIGKNIIAAVRKEVSIPLLVGGGIDSGRKARAACAAGANIVVVGNALETDPNLIYEIASVF